MQHKITSKKYTWRTSAFLILSLMLASLTGCGKTAGEAAPPTAEPIPAEAPSNENAGNAPLNDGQSTENGQNSGGDSAPQNNIAPQSDTELNGDVRTIGQDSFVVSQIFLMPAEGSDAEGTEDVELAISPAEGSEDEVLITVHVSENTLYKIHSVKNGGVNGDADVEKTDGSFTDIREGNSIVAQGNYKDGDFWADNIIIYRFL